MSLPSPDASEPPASAPRPRRPGRRLLIAVAAVAAIAAIVLAVRVGPDLAVRWLGPPAVTAREAHPPRPGGPVVDHETLDRLLARFVDDRGGVDYAGLADAEADLDAYLATLAAAPLEDLGRDERLALLINAYNACTLRLILDHRPIESIRDIPAAERWSAVRWTIGGRRLSLEQIEHEEIRPNFVEPRIHFALVCAAVGCPPLRAEAYRGARLDVQLADQARIVHDDPRWFRFDDEAGVAHLTPLYRWYRGDFEQVAGSVLAYAARHAPALGRALDAGRVPEVRFLEYDWSLNTRSPAP